MTRYILFLLLSTSSILAQHNNILVQPKVDKRVELLSLAFRLAGSSEYSSEKFEVYTNRIYQHYNKYKNHELIEFIRYLRKENGVSYDAVMDMAIHLDSNYTNLIEFSEQIPDKRWGKNNAYKFTTLLQKFNKDSKSELFFESNQKLYDSVLKRFQPIYEKIDLRWYLNFYGKEPVEKFKIVIGLGNGGGNYGPDIEYPDGKKEIYAIMGTWKIDSLGMPIFPIENYLPTILHEFNHSFINHLIEKKANSFEKNGEILYESVKDVMKSQAYGNWITMINESLVRAAVIKYMQDHDFEEKEIIKKINSQKSKGFYWINDLVFELSKYDKNRDKYAALEDFIPNIARAFADYAQNFEAYKQEFQNVRPKVLSITEFSNGDKNVNHDIETITINFDKALSGNGYSFAYGKKGEKAFPKINDIIYSENKKSIILKCELKSKKVYQFILTGKDFKTSNGISIDDYQVDFSTD